MKRVSHPPTVSIVIPTFNRADFAREAIEKSLAQTADCEIILVNHGSTDHTDDVAKEFGEQIVYVKRDKDFGPHFCWLDGVMHSTSDFVHMQFDDDWIEPRYVSECMQLMTPETGFVFSSNAIYYDETDKMEAEPHTGPMKGTGIYSSSAMERWFMKRLISPGAMIYRRSDLIDALYQGNLPFSANHYHGVGPDLYVTLLCLLRYPKFGFVDEHLAIFRAHPGSITVNARTEIKTARSIKKAYREVRRHYKELKHLKRRRSLIDRLPKLHYLTDRVPRTREIRRMIHKGEK
jgi:glycosyltransferase involved in cell wall biosynthesis